MNFYIRVIGSGAAVPSTMRKLSAQVVNVHDRLYLVDCAEGTQLELMNLGVSMMKFHQIFISHLHGDHFFGLIGLITSMHLMGRKSRLQIFGPPGLKEVLDVTMKHSNTVLSYPYEILELAPKEPEVIFETEQLTVEAFPLVHSVPTMGFLFREKPFSKRLRKVFVKENNIPPDQFEKIKDGADYRDESGRIYKNEEITHPARLSRSYAYCSDTAYDDAIIKNVQGVNVLYHEATFNKDMVDIAHEKLHTTAEEAALTAKKAGARKLIIGHLSARYKTGRSLLSEARKVFPETYLARDGLKFEVD